MTTIETEARNASLEDLVPMLQRLHELKLDAVVPEQSIRAEKGLLRVEGLKVFGDAIVRPTAIMDGQIAGHLNIPVKYLRQMRAERVDLYDANVNGWLHGYSDIDTIVPGRQGSVLLRTFLDPNEGGGEGVGRALLSDRYGAIEHIDVLMAALEGIAESGVECQVVRANLTETRMSVRFAAPGIAALAPVLLGGYRPNAEGIEQFHAPASPVIAQLRERYGIDHLGYAPGTEPIVFAGFDLDNSETGGGAFNLGAVFTVEACKNGLKLDAVQSLRRIHLGSKLEAGIVKWSHETRQKQAELVRSQTKDAVQAFLSEDFLVESLQGIEAKAGAPIAATDVTKTLEHVAKELAYTQEQQAGILAHFISGGQLTTGGVLNAVTSYAQTVESADEAYDLESGAMKALEVAFAAV